MNNWGWREFERGDTTVDFPCYGIIDLRLHEISCWERGIDMSFVIRGLMTGGLEDVDEFSSATTEVPESFLSIQVRLALVIETLRGVQMSWTSTTKFG
jgi:hypothetical protein